jgi:glycosyltransferase involved in cell wall biosynthesis
MACNCPIVATDVGDIRELINGVLGCSIVKHEVESVVEAIKNIISSGKRSNGRMRLQNISSVKISNELVNLYQSIIGKNRL